MATTPLACPQTVVPNTVYQINDCTRRKAYIKIRLNGATSVTLNGMLTSDDASPEPTVISADDTKTLYDMPPFFSFTFQNPSTETPPQVIVYHGPT